MKYNFLLAGVIQSIDLLKTGGGYRALWNGEEFPVDAVEHRNGELSFGLGGRRERAFVAVDGTHIWIWLHGKTVALAEANASKRVRPRSERGGAGERIIAAPMPGSVAVVKVSEGDVVSKGDLLFVLEAMKMEIQVRAHRAGTLVRLNARPGQTVEREQVLAEIE